MADPASVPSTCSAVDSLPEQPPQKHNESSSKGGLGLPSSTGHESRQRTNRFSVSGLNGIEAFEQLMTSEYIDGPPPKGFWARCVYRFQTIPNRIIFRVAGQDTKALKQTLCLFPLSFRGADMEKKYLQSRRASAHLQSWILGILCMSLICLFWVFYMIGYISVPEFGTPDILSISRAWFTVGMSISLMGAIFFILFDIFDRQVHIPLSDGIALGCLSLVCAGPCIWTLGVLAKWNVKEIPEKVLQTELLEYLSNIAVQHHAYFLIMTSLFVVTLFAIDMLLTVRFFLRILIHIVFIIIFTVCDILNLASAYYGALPQLPFFKGFFTIYKVAITIELIVFWITVILALFGGLCKDLVDRVEFFRWTTSFEMLEALRQRQDLEPKDGGSATVVEHITTLIERAKDAMTTASTIPSSVGLLEGQEILERILQMLRNSTNLYSLASGGVGAASEWTQPTDRQIYQNQFLTVYGGRAPQTNTLMYLDPGLRHHSSSRSEEWKQPRLSESEINVLPKNLRCELEANVGINIHFDFLKWQESFPSAILEDVGLILLKDSFGSLQTTPEIAKHLLGRLQSLYFPNPYHNATHAAVVAHILVCLIRDIDCIRESRDFSDLDYAVSVIAALGHDAGHPGRSNPFFINKLDNIAVVWNDKSVLENFHCAVLCKILQENQSNVFSKFTYNKFNTIRDRIIQLVLATDMSLHFENMGRLKLRLGSPDFDPTTIFDDVWMVVKQCLKAADLSHAFMPWNIHLHWSLRVAEEFYQQGDEEQSRGFPVSPLCVRSELSDLPKSQAGFITFVVIPLLEQLDSLPGFHTIDSRCLAFAKKNYFTWGQMVPVSDREFHENLLRDQEEKEAEKITSVRFSSTTFSSRISVKAPNERKLSRELKCPPSPRGSGLEDVHQPVILEMPPDIASMKTNTHSIWDLFTEVMALEVPDPLPHLINAPKKAQKPSDRANASLASPRSGPAVKTAIISSLGIPKRRSSEEHQSK